MERLQLTITYEDKLKERNITALTTFEKQALISVFVQQLQNQNRLCCDKDENDLAVTEVDRFGFVKEVSCNRCQSIMQTPFLYTYKEKLRQKHLTSILNVKHMPNVLSAVVQQLRNQSINNRLCCDNDENDLVVTDVDWLGFVTEVTCQKCEQTTQTRFLGTYKHKLEQESIAFNDKDMPNVLSAVVQQLRNQCTNKRLCCDNDENDLVVTDVDSDGFVTEVKCDKCQHNMQTPFLHTYQQRLKQQDITLDYKDLPNSLSVIVQQLRNQSTNNRLCCDNDQNNLAVTDVDSDGLVTAFTCQICKQTTQMHFLRTYKEKLRLKEITKLDKMDLPNVLSSTVLLLRRHSITGTTCDKPRCCSNNVNDLTVEHVDSFGFVTEVKCSQCNEPWKPYATTQNGHTKESSMNLTLDQEITSAGTDGTAYGTML